MILIGVEMTVEEVGEALMGVAAEVAVSRRGGLLWFCRGVPGDSQGGTTAGSRNYCTYRLS